MTVWIAAALYLALAAAVAALRGRPAYPAAKALAGLGFCAVAAAGMAGIGGCPWPWPLPAGFVLCAAGDVAMGAYNLRRRPGALLAGGLSAYDAARLAALLHALAGEVWPRRGFCADDLPDRLPEAFAVVSPLA